MSFILSEYQYSERHGSLLYSSRRRNGGETKQNYDNVQKLSPRRCRVARENLRRLGSKWEKCRTWYTFIIIIYWNSPAAKSCSVSHNSTINGVTHCMLNNNVMWAFFLPPPPLDNNYTLFFYYFHFFLPPITIQIICLFKADKLLSRKKHLKGHCTTSQHVKFI